MPAIYRAPTRARGRDLPAGAGAARALAEGVVGIGDPLAARATGIVHVRPATWLDRPFGEHEVPAAVAATFARGGRNFQRIHDQRAEAETGALWLIASRAAGRTPRPAGRA